MVREYDHHENEGRCEVCRDYGRAYFVTIGIYSVVLCEACAQQTIDDINKRK